MYKIVIIDDEKWVIEGLKSSINWKEEGFQVVNRGFNGEMALDIVKEDQPDLLITDIRMPGMDGISLLKQIRKNYPGILVMMISGFSDFNHVREALHGGAVGYLAKPFDILEIKTQLSVVKNLLIERDQHYFEQYIKEDPVDITNLLEKYNIILNGQTQYTIIALGVTGSEIPEITPCFKVKEALYLTVVPSNHTEEVLGRCSYNSVGIISGIKYKTEIKEGIKASIDLSYGVFIDPSLKENRRSLKSLRSVSSIFQILITDIENMERESVELFFKQLKGRFINGELSILDVLAFYNQLSSYLNFRAVEELPIITNLNNLTLLYNNLDKLIIILRKHVRSILKSPVMILSSSQFRPIVSSALEFINDNYLNYINIQDVADKVETSSSYLSQVFKKETNITLITYVTSLRLERAKQLLLETRYTVGEISEMVGYSDYFYFTKLFKKHYGSTPSRYKKL